MAVMRLLKVAIDMGDDGMLAGTSNPFRMVVISPHRVQLAREFPGARLTRDRCGLGDSGLEYTASWYRLAMLGSAASSVRRASTCGRASFRKLDVARREFGGHAGLATVVLALKILLPVSARSSAA